MTLNRWKEGLRELGSSVFALTADERKILCLILALAILGVGAKVWHRHHLTGRDHPAIQEVPNE